MPAGVPSSFQAYDPHPIVVKHAAGSRMIDVDGNEYVDYDMGFGALFAGHMNPAVRRAVEAQLDNGTLYVTPCELDAEVAELLADRYDLPMWRPTNSGTEATMDAIRLARGVTKREKLVKVEGGYHGHHDEVMISNKPPLDKAGPADAPHSIPQSAGITAGHDRRRDRHPVQRRRRARAGAAVGDVAAFIVEPVMQNIGICLPRARLPRGGPRDHRALRHAADLRRGQDRHHRRLRRRHRALRRPARPRLPGEVDRRRLPRRRVRRQGRVHGPHHHRRGAPPRHLQRQPARDGRRQGDAHRGVHAPRPSTPRSPATSGWSTPASDVIDRTGVPAHTVQFGAKGCVTWARDADPQLPRLQGDRLRPRVRPVDPRHQPRRHAPAGPRRPVADLGDARRGRHDAQRRRVRRVRRRACPRLLGKLAQREGLIANPRIKQRIIGRR